MSFCRAITGCHPERSLAVILSIDSRGAALAEQKLRSSFEFGCDLCEGSQGVIGSYDRC